MPTETWPVTLGIHDLSLRIFYQCNIIICTFWEIIVSCVMIFPSSYDFSSIFEAMLCTSNNDFMSAIYIYISFELS